MPVDRENRPLTGPQSAHLTRHHHTEAHGHVPHTYAPAMTTAATTTCAPSTTYATTHVPQTSTIITEAPAPMIEKPVHRTELEHFAHHNEYCKMEHYEHTGGRLNTAIFDAAAEVASPVLGNVENIH